MADAIQSFQNITNDAILQNGVDTVDAVEENTSRENRRTQINLHKTAIEQIDANYASATEPTQKSQGKEWFNTATQEMNFYYDNSQNKRVVATLDGTQEFTNKTYTNPVFSPAGGKSYLGLSRDLKLKIINNSSNPNNQIDITFGHLTFYDDTGRGAVESQASALTLDVSTSGAGGRAIDVTAEGSASEQSSIWYYIYVYSNGSGVINGILSTNSSWSSVASADKPSGSDYVRRVGAVRNDSGGDFLYMEQIDDLCGLESSTLYNIGSTTSTTWVSTDLSSLIPESAIQIYGIAGSVASGSIVARISPTNAISSTLNAPFVSLTGSAGNTGAYVSYTIPITETQTCYIANGLGSGQCDFGLKGFKVSL